MFGFRSQKSSVGTLLSEEREILNGALEAVLKTGDDSPVSIQKFLGQHHPDLIREELDVYARICRSVVKHGHEMLQAAGNEEEKNKARPLWQASTLSEFPWISDANLELLASCDAYHSENDVLPELTANSIPGYGLTL
jgi:hypothetical protein